MEGINSSQSNKQPSIELIEKSESKDAPVRTRSLSGMEIITDLDTLQKFEEDEILAEARKSIFNERVYNLYLNAIKNKYGGDVRSFTALENIILRHCINIRNERDIDNMVSGFCREAVRYAQSMRGIIDNRILEDISSMSRKITPDAEGVKSVINYIRNRSRILSANPEQKFEFCTNDELDSIWSIDLIEVIFDKEDIDQLNLVQVKSSQVPEDEKAEIQDDHRSWIEERAVSDVEMAELFVSEPNAALEFEHLIEDQEKIYEKFFDICAGESVNNTALAEQLGISVLPKKEQAWLLNKHISTLTALLKSMEDEGYIDTEHSELVRNNLISLRRTLIDKTHLPVNTVKINSIKSIIAVGGKITDEMVIQAKEEGHAKLGARRIDNKTN